MTDGQLPVRGKVHLAEVPVKSKDPHLFLEVDFKTAKGTFWAVVELKAVPGDLLATGVLRTAHGLEETQALRATVFTLLFDDWSEVEREAEICIAETTLSTVLLSHEAKGGPRLQVLDALRDVRERHPDDAERLAKYFWNDIRESLPRQDLESVRSLLTTAAVEHGAAFLKECPGYRPADLPDYLQSLYLCTPAGEPFFHVETDTTPADIKREVGFWEDRRSITDSVRRTYLRNGASKEELDWSLGVLEERLWSCQRSGALRTLFHK